MSSFNCTKDVTQNYHPEGQAEWHMGLMTGALAHCPCLPEAVKEDSEQRNQVGFVPAPAESKHAFL